MFFLSQFISFFFFFLIQVLQQVSSYTILDFYYLFLSLPRLIWRNVMGLSHHNNEISSCIYYIYITRVFTSRFAWQLLFYHLKSYFIYYTNLLYNHTISSLYSFTISFNFFFKFFIYSFFILYIFIICFQWSWLRREKDEIFVNKVIYLVLHTWI